VRRAKTNRRKTVKRRPKLPKVRVNWKLLLVVPAALAALAGTFVGAQALLDHPVRQLDVEAVFQRVTAIQVEAALAPALDRGFLSVDLGKLRRRVEALDWVDSAEVAREWPDTLAVRIVEHQAAARWGESGLLNTRGELFTEASRHAFPELPQLDGPPGSEREVAGWYLALRGRLTEANLALNALVMDDRGAWRIELEAGQEIRLGRRDIGARLERFFRVAAPALAGDLNRVSYVDLRYTNGFAVGWASDAGLRLADLGKVPGSG